MTGLTEESERLMDLLQGLVGQGERRPPAAGRIAPVAVDDELDEGTVAPGPVVLDPATIRDVIAPEIERMLRRGQLGGAGGTRLGGRRRDE